MNPDLTKSLKVLENTPEVFRELLNDLDRNLLLSSEGEGKWSPAEIVCHMIHCEEDDWIPRMEIILRDSGDKKFKPFERTFGFEKSTMPINELLDEFERLRKLNMEKLKTIDFTERTLMKTGIHPDFGEVNLKQLLSAWVVHDLSHIAQICRVIARQHTSEVGPWKQYLPILNI